MRRHEREMLDISCFGSRKCLRSEYTTILTFCEKNPIMIVWENYLDKRFFEKIINLFFRSVNGLGLRKSLSEPRVIFQQGSRRASGTAVSSVVCHHVHVPSLACSCSVSVPSTSFLAGEWGTLNFGHAKSSTKTFHQISNFSFGGGDTLNIGYAKSAIKCFAKFPTFHFQQEGMGYNKFWPCQIYHKNFCQIFVSGRGDTSNYGHAKSAIKGFAKFPTFHLQEGTSHFGHAKSTIKTFH